ncbi:MAG: hypothetical protein CVT81_08910 [Alphaproteobacteria bacterium HGW-Alphaproteobacteria-3]|jgi:pimeloyl-ACP methyl ester carboxylesterase|nr:MAG: hypothetical protein CVT81_08910 [Alphaproteobacteria bacterium HGW-Alphaproteobacteria-3]
MTALETTGMPQPAAHDDAPAVMLIHGMWSRPHVWDGFRAYFEDRGYKVIVPTLRHHAVSADGRPHPGLATTSVADYVSDIAREIGKLGRKPLVIGHSMGGLIAQLLAARGLARAVVGLAPAQIAGAFNYDLRTTWIFRREFSSWGFWRKPQLPSFEAMRFGALNRMSNAEAEDLYTTLVPESGRTLLEIGLWFLDRQRTTWINPADVCCPMLFLTGAEDRLTPLWLTRHVTEFYEGKARLETVADRGHWLPSEPGWERLAERAALFFETEAADMARSLSPQVRALAGELAAAR